MYDPNFNPDYPTGGMWDRNTYAPLNYQQEQQTFYYGGATNPFDSRRNIGQPQQQFGYQQPLNYATCQQQIPEANLMPFSSYPPANPQQAQQQFGFNQMIESRRNVGVNATGTNPWAQPTQAQQAFQQPQQTQFQPQYGYCTYPTQTAMDWNMPVNAYDKHTPSWDNGYTCQRQVFAPVIDWSSVNQNSNQQYGSFAQYPVDYSIAQSDMNWVEKCQKNWNV